MGEKLFFESQAVVPQMLGLLLMALFAALAVFAAYMLLEGYIDILSAEGLSMIVAVLTVFVIAMVTAYMLKIKTTVTGESLTVGMIKGRTVPIGEIASAVSEDFRAIKDFGGWGLRYGAKGWGYIAAGTNKGLRINMKDGKSLLISTKRMFELESAVKAAIKANEHNSKRK